ncbi:hypothetical protein B0H11DRAFT_1337336 [Mycena galericulata]|nr:hypothetical protein B0H11DRAFT_1337336 [Mycena galericulata]
MSSCSLLFRARLLLGDTVGIASFVRTGGIPHRPTASTSQGGGTTRSCGSSFCATTTETNPTSYGSRYSSSSPTARRSSALFSIIWQGPARSVWSRWTIRPAITLRPQIVHGKHFLRGYTVLLSTGRAAEARTNLSRAWPCTMSCAQTAPSYPTASCSCRLSCQKRWMRKRLRRWRIKFVYGSGS